MNITVGVSNRHVHLTEEVYNKLFDKPLEKLKDLDQPGQFAAKQMVDIKVGDKVLKRLRIVGPLRSYNQVELSRTDCFFLGVNPPVRTSGDIEGSVPVTIIGPKGSVALNKGLIIANRHIHITPLEMEEYGFSGLEKVSVKVGGEKGGILDNVYFKVAENSGYRLHLDTDDANAFDLKDNDEVEIIR